MREQGLEQVPLMYLFDKHPVLSGWKLVVSGVFRAPSNRVWLTPRNLNETF